MNSVVQFPLLILFFLLSSLLMQIVAALFPQIDGILPIRSSKIKRVQSLDDHKQQKGSSRNTWFTTEKDQADPNDKAENEAANANDGWEEDGEYEDPFGRGTFNGNGLGAKPMAMANGRFEFAHQSEESGQNDRFGRTNRPGRNGAAENDPSAAFWANAIGPFLFVFENMDRSNSRTIWKPAIDELNRLRTERMGKTFGHLTWDEQLTDKVRQISFTEMHPQSVVIKKPENGVLPNLLRGIQTLYSALIWQNVVCRRGGECRVALSKRRPSAELIDSKARRIGCNGRLYKTALSRELRFAVVCATDRSVENGQNIYQLNLFGLNQLQNGPLREKLRWNSVDTFENGEKAEEDETDEMAPRGERKYKPKVPKNVPPKPSCPVSVQSGDIVRIRADAIVDPVKGSLFAALLQSPAEEAVDKVLGAESVLDVLDMDEEDNLLGKGTVRRQLRRLTELVGPSGNGTEAKKTTARERAARAKQQLEHWLQALKVPQTFAALQAEIEGWRQRKNASTGADQRILTQGGPALKEKLRELAQRRGAAGALVPGDAVATDAFEIRDKFFAKAIIHTVPPSELLTQRDFEKLADCFRRSLEVASSHGFSSIAFPEMLAQNATDRDKEQAAQIGVEAVAKWLNKRPDSKIKTITFVVSRDQKMLKQYQQLVKQKFEKKN